MFDQAASLRKRVRSKENMGSRIIAIASGKGGVGKTNATVNIGLALQKNNKNVLLVDADLGTANIDVLLGLTPKYNIGHLLSGEYDYREVLMAGPAGLDILPGTSGVEEYLNISQRQIKGLMDLSSQMVDTYDIILVDIGAGIHGSNIKFITSCEEVIVVLAPEPTAIMDAYSLIKILYNNEFKGNIGLLVNQLNSQQEGKAIIGRMEKVIHDYLDIDITTIGLIPFDNHLRQAVKKQKALLELYPRSKAGQAFFEAANNIVNLEKINRNNTDREGFINHLLNLFR